MLAGDFRPDLVHYSKWRLAGQVIQRIQLLQRNAYNFKPVPLIQNYLLQVFSGEVFFFRNLTVFAREKSSKTIWCCTSSRCA
jgi:hypothetical protein